MLGQTRRARPAAIQRVLAYGRVSTERQADRGTSLQGQREEFIAYCRREKLPDPDMRFEVEGAGEANEERRLELHRIMAEARAGDLVLVSKIDRWSRHAAFALTTAEELERRGVVFRSIAEPGDIRHDKLHFGIRALFAEEDHKRIKARTVGRRRELRLQGHWTEGSAPLGYRIEKRRLVIDQDKALIVKWIFERCIAGDSVRTIATAMPRVWGEKLETSALAYALKNRHYLGEYQTAAGREEIGGVSIGPRFGSGEWVRAHEPIIDRHTFELAGRAVQKRKKQSGRPGSSPLTQDWLGKGFLRCALCGASLESKPYTTAIYKNPGHDGWYGCRRRMAPKLTETKCDGGPLVRRTLVDDALAIAMQKRMKALRLFYGKAKPSAKPRTAAVDFTARRARIAAKRARVVDAFADDSGMSRSDLSRKLEALDAELRSLDADEYEHQKLAANEVTDTPARRGEAVSALLDFERAWGVMKPPEMRRMVSLFAEEILVDGEAALTITWREPAAVLGVLVAC